MRTILFLSISTVFLFSAGCSKDDGRPKDMPKLYPVHISITQESKPLEGATVTLMEKTPSKYGASSGTTDVAGTVKVLTYGYEGVPAGEYAVLVKKVGTEGAKEAKTPEGMSLSVGGKSYGYVDDKFSTVNSTPLSITVTDKGATETFDVGAPVRTFLGNVPE